ncbi:hypothetical protein B0H14DRAFT_3435552 [Mycena olivaceomarginata]|nr:hypothetical protein B0H14DRAFT_3435552 [Mycena olivaceomarginata]
MGDPKWTPKRIDVGVNAEQKLKGKGEIEISGGELQDGSCRSTLLVDSLAALPPRRSPPRRTHPPPPPERDLEHQVPLDALCIHLLLFTQTPPPPRGAGRRPRGGGKAARAPAPALRPLRGRAPRREHLPAPPCDPEHPPTRAHPTPLSITVPPTSSAPPPTGRRRAPSFSAGSGAALPRSLGGLSSLTRAAQLYPHNLHPASSHSSPHAASSSHPVYNNTAYSLCSSAPSPAPSLARSRSPQPPPPPPAPSTGVANAPSAFHARHYPTPDARARLLARTLLTRIHAVGRPRGASAAFHSCAKSASASSSRKSVNGCESARGPYVPSRLRECTVAC